MTPQFSNLLSALRRMDSRALVSEVGFARAALSDDGVAESRAARLRGLGLHVDADGVRRRARAILLLAEAEVRRREDARPVSPPKSATKKPG